MTVNMMEVTSVDICPPTRRCATRFHTRKRHNLLEAEGGLAALEGKEKVELEADLSLLVHVAQPPLEAEGGVEADQQRPHAPINFRTMRLSSWMVRKATKTKPSWMTWRMGSPFTRDWVIR